MISYALLLGQGNSLPCKLEEFTCSNGQYISGDKECDSVMDCTDGTDDILNVAG